MGWSWSGIFKQSPINSNMQLRLRNTVHEGVLRTQRAMEVVTRKPSGHLLPTCGNRMLNGGHLGYTIGEIST